MSRCPSGHGSVSPTASIRRPFIASSFVLLVMSGLYAVTANAQTPTGTVKGSVRLTGAPPGNPIIRMGMDPKCSQMNAGKRVIQDVVSADERGNLANVFVRLEGNFPPTAVPQSSVVIDQHSCVYTPRVVGMRVGQALLVRNSDNVAHDVHGVSAVGNDFNVTIPAGHGAFESRPQREEVMLRIICDIHKWMVTYVGVVGNPYFAVSGRGGTFEIDKVPPGTYTIEAWQEKYGVVKKTVRVMTGETATVDFTYSGGKTP